MGFKVLSAALSGLDAQIIEVETDVSFGLRSFSIVGLPDKAVEESKERVASAIKSSGFASPFSQPQRILVNLAPADLKKEGALYDLPIALSYLLASQQIKIESQKKIIAGELALDGKLRPIKGALSLALAAKEKGFNHLILPKENAKEAALALLGNQNLCNLRIYGFEYLKEVIDFLESRKDFACETTDLQEIFEKPDYQIDISWIKGQESAKRVLEVSAAGGHNILFQGPPGAGKSILAKSLPSILPRLSREESLEVTKIYSFAGLLPKEKPIINFRPFRSPHHTSSEAALLGGGTPIRPGEITLSHRGVLFLDEFPEFHRDVLESLRQPLEEGKIAIMRAKDKIVFPAKFTLVAAANPCPCGFYKDPNRRCQCQPSQVAMYRRKLSGPFIDRIDLFIDVPAVKFEKLSSQDLDIESSNKIREKIEKARLIQANRFSQENAKIKERIFLNSEIPLPLIKKYCQVDFPSREILKKFVDSGKLSARGYHRVLKTARTIADLDNSENIKYDHLTEALMYRVRDN